MSHAALAYAFVIGLVAAYVWTLGVRQRAVDREIADLEDPDEDDGTSGGSRRER